MAAQAAARQAARRLAELQRSVQDLARLQGAVANAPGSTAGTETAAVAAPVAAPATGLQPGKLAWNTPPRMAMGDSAEVELRVTLDETLFPGLEARVRAGGSTTSEVAELSRDLSARLQSTAFDITPDGERRQPVRQGRDAVWVWVISPKQKGAQKLLLSITAHVPGGPAFQPLVRTIEVTAAAGSTPAAMLDFLQRNWDKLLTLVLIPLAAWAWKAHQGRRTRRLPASAASQPAPPPPALRDAA